MRKKIVLANLDIANGNKYDLVFFPLGLLSLGTILESCGLEVIYFDINQPVLLLLDLREKLTMI